MNIGVASLSSTWGSSVRSSTTIEPIRPTNDVAPSAEAAHDAAPSSSAPASSSTDTARAMDRMMYARIFQAEQARAARLAANHTNSQAQRYSQVADASDDPAKDNSVTLSHA